MAIDKGWLIKMKGPDVYWTLRTDNGLTSEIEDALLFARERDAMEYLGYHFHGSVKSDYVVLGIH